MQTQKTSTSESMAPRRNLLPLIVAVSALLLAGENFLPQLPMLSVVFIGVVLLSLWSSQRWHTYLAAGLGTACALLPLRAPVALYFWIVAANAALAIAAIWSAALLGIAAMRRTRNEMSTRTAAANLKQQSPSQETLRQLTLAAEAAGLWLWEGAVDGTTLWDTNRPKGLGLEEVEAAHVYAYFTRLMDRDERNAANAAIRAAIAARTTNIAQNYRIHAPDGTVRYYQGRARLICDQTNRPVRLIGITQDNTQEVIKTEQFRQQAAELHEVQSRLQRASESSQEGHWEVDLLTGKYWISASYRILLGYAPEFDLSTREAYLDIVHPDDMVIQRELTERCIVTGLSYECDMRLQHANGEWRWIHARGNAERNAEGVPVRLSGSIQDIHKQKLAEDRLRSVRERFERAIRGTQDGLWEDELLHSEAIWCSPRYLELLGYDPNEVSDTMSRSELLELIHPDDLARVTQARRDVIDAGRALDIEHRMRTQGGSWLWMRTRATVEFDAAGQACRMSGSMQDVTEAYLAREELIKATQEAQAGNRAKSDFIANVSHELRTPMNGIIGMTDLLLATQLDRTQLEYAETVRNSADALLTVINDILDFSKVEAGKLDIEAIEMDLRGSVEDVGVMMGFQAAAKRLELIVNVRPEVPERLLGDPQRIRQCLINLVGNAVKFTHQGEVVIEVCTLGRHDGKVLTHFEVRDTGIGIDKATLAALFQPFVQADSSTTRRFGGTGLGLSIVKRMAERMGGQAGVASEPGKGSTFWFTVPLEEVAAGNVIPVAASAALGKRILLVDDSATNRRVLSTQLAHVGYDIEQAANGGEALAMMHQAVLNQRPFDAVLADYQLPDMDGAMLGERINATASIANARVVMLTSLDRYGDIARFSALGFAAYLTKPIRRSELFECLDRVLLREAREWHMQSQPLLTRGALQAGAMHERYSGHVLLVEDNPVNQKVAARFLERMGCTVTVAGDGNEALTACKGGRFQLVLMDLQMPLMDGYAATRRIRELEAGRPRTPIVALTANAMQEQWQRCLAAGMDGFLTKPVEVERLREVVEKYCSLDERFLQLDNSSASLAGAIAPNSGSLGAVPIGADIEPVDLEKLAVVIGSDTAFASELAAVYAESARHIYAAIVTHVECGERRQLRRALHKLKGASANIYATAVHALCEQLERDAEQASDADLQTAIGTLEVQLKQAMTALHSIATRAQSAA